MFPVPETTGYEDPFSSCYGQNLNLMTSSISRGIARRDK
jgi:hypothetical protein